MNEGTGEEEGTIDRNWPFDIIPRVIPARDWDTVSRGLAQRSRALNRFIELHPGSPDVAYAYYLKAISYYEQISDVRRDQKATAEALSALEELVRRFNEENNEEAGEHWTPRDAVKLMAKLIFLPIAVEPVKVILSMSGCEVISGPRLRLMSITGRVLPLPVKNPARQVPSTLNPPPRQSTRK